MISLSSPPRPLSPSPPPVRMSITKIHAREILDSRGNPTVEVDLFTAKGNTHTKNIHTIDLQALMCVCVWESGG